MVLSMVLEAPADKHPPHTHTLSLVGSPASPNKKMLLQQSQAAPSKEPRKHFSDADHIRGKQNRTGSHRSMVLKLGLILEASRAPEKQGGAARSP